MVNYTFNDIQMIIREISTDITYAINNPSEPYNEWFSEILFYFRDLDNLRKESGLDKDNLLNDENLANNFNSAMKKYLSDDKDFDTVNLLEE